MIRKITEVSCCITYSLLHQDLALETLHQIAARATSRSADWPHAHINKEVIMLLENPIKQRLRRKTLVNIIS